MADKGWTEAIEIEVGDKVLLQDGTTAIIEDKIAEQFDTPVKVYNFTVDEFHTYFVGEDRVLVHNSCLTDVQREVWKKYTGTEAKGEVHHGLPEELSDWFLKRGLDVNSGEFYYDLPTDVHRLKTGAGIHTNNSPLGENWNKIWRKFKLENEFTATADDILYQLFLMERGAGIEGYRAVSGK